MARWLRISILVATTLTIARVPFLLAQFRHLVDRGQEPLATRPFDATIDVPGSFAGVAFLVTICLWLAWHYGVQRRLAAAGPTRYAPAWTVLWWFIPFADFVMPSATTADSVRAAGQVSHGEPSDTVLVWFWWLVWFPAMLTFAVGSAVRSAGIAGQSFVAPGEDPFDVGNMVATVRIGDALLVVSSVLVAAAAVFAIALVTKVHRAMAAMAPPAAPPRPDLV
jgi:hypothetical protein